MPEKKKSVASAGGWFRDYDPTVHGVTQSLLLNWMTCRRRAWHYLLGWVNAKEKDSAAWGTAIHWLIEHHYLGMAPSVDQYLTAKKLKSKDLSQAQHVALGVVQGVYEAYAQYWRIQDAARQWVGMEAQFTQPFAVGSVTVPLRGKRDAMYRGKHKKLWLLETKTTWQIDEENRADQLPFDFQNLFYIVATELEFGEPVAGVLYNMIRKPAHRLGAKETVADHLLRVQEAVQAKPDDYFVRFEIAYPRATVDEFKAHLNSILSEFLLWCKNKGPTYPNSSACMGKWVCEYLKACGQCSYVGYQPREALFTELED